MNGSGAATPRPSSARHAAPGRCRSCSEGDESPGEPPPGGDVPGQGRLCRAKGLSRGSKASKRAHRGLTRRLTPPSRTGAPRAFPKARRSLAPRPRGPRVPAAIVATPGGDAARRRRASESGREARWCRKGDGRSSAANPQGSKGPRERARLSGEKKALKGVPRTRAAWKKAAKRRGVTAHGGPARVRASREHGPNRRGGQVPRGRRRREVAPLARTRPAAGTGASRNRGGARRSSSDGAGETKSPPATERSRSGPLDRLMTGEERASPNGRAFGERQRHERSRRAPRPASPRDEEHPEAVETAWGERLTPNGRYSQREGLCRRRGLLEPARARVTAVSRP